jgi:tellurite resistance protein
MEAILTIIAIVFGFQIISWLFGVVFGTAKAAVKSAVGKGSFSENLDLEFKGMGAFEIRAVKENRNGIEGIIIQGRGIIPVSYRTHIGFVTSVWDATGEKSPIISMADGFKEPNSTAYQQIVDAGTVEENQGYAQWVQVGVVIPSILYPPEGGQRKLFIVTRIIYMDNPPDIYLGQCDQGDDGVLTVSATYSDFYFEGKGYSESAEDRDEARGLAIKLGMSVAMADGSLDDSEGEVIKEWIVKTISPFSDEKQKNLKELYNNALREAYSEAQSGNLSLSDVTKKINQLADSPQKYEAIELCFEVMAADGVADENELKTIKSIAEALDLDFEEIKNLHDKHLLNLDIATEQQASIETMLQIDTDWTNEQIKKHLREEYSKWNNRINTLDEGQERDNAQQMLDLIAEARKKYA